jgi:hypothetical protein
MPGDFVIEPGCTRYGPAGGFEDLKRHLEESRATKPLEIRQPEDILLSLDGMVQQAYRFTPFGLYTLCRKLSPNLGSVISDIAGISNRPSAKLKSDTRAAVHVLNTVIKLRFDDALRGSRMIVDPIRRTIDGLVGTRYEFLGNYELFTSANKFVESHGGQFLDGSLVGRRLMIKYVLPDYGCQSSYGFYSLGWAFSNSENGQSAVRAGLLFVDENGLSSLRQVVRRQHTSSLRNHISDWLTDPILGASKEIDWSTFADAMDHLGAVHFPKASNGVQAARMADMLTADLTKRISKGAAREVARAVFTPSQVLVGGSSSPVPEHSVRTHHSLYEALTTKAGDYSPQDQENIESLAYELLRGRYKPFKGD